MDTVFFWSVVIAVVGLVGVLIYLIRFFDCFKDDTHVNQEANVPIVNRENLYPRGASYSSERRTFPILSSQNRRNNYSTNGSTGQPFSEPEANFQMPSDAANPIHDEIRPRTRLHVDLDELLPRSNPCFTSPPSYAEAMASADAARDYKSTSFQKSSIPK